MNMEKNKKIKSSLLAVSLLLLLLIGLGGSIAFLFDSTDSVSNMFTPAKITTTVDEDFDGTTKSNVKIQNTGNTSAWIRAAVIVTWQDANGNIYGRAPVIGNDYTINCNLSNTGWKKGSDGFYYWTKPVKPVTETADDCYTGILITECKSMPTAPENYTLCVEIICSGIQSRPTAAFDEQWGTGSGLKVSADGNSLIAKGGSD